MIRNLIAVVAGVVAGGIVVALVEGVGHMFYPPPAGVDVSDPKALAGLMDKIPVGAKIAVVVAWALGSLAGGCTAASFGTNRRTVLALAVGGVLLALGGYSLVTIPHPAWMMALGILLPLPMAWMGSRLKRN
jgi:hypothetical protein